MMPMVYLRTICFRFKNSYEDRASIGFHEIVFYAKPDWLTSADCANR